MINIAPYDGDPGLPGRRNRIEADQDVGKSGCPRQQGNPQGEMLSRGLSYWQARFQKTPARTGHNT